MRIQITSSHVLGPGRVAEVGDILDLPDREAEVKIRRGYAVPAPASVAPSPTPPGEIEFGETETEHRDPGAKQAGGKPAGGKRS